MLALAIVAGLTTIVLGCLLLTALILSQEAWIERNIDAEDRCPELLRRVHGEQTIRWDRCEMRVGHAGPHCTKGPNDIAPQWWSTDKDADDEPDEAA